MRGFFEPPPPPGQEPGPRNPAGGEPQHRPDRQHAARPVWNLHLESAGTNVPARFLTESPMLTVLAVEDLCWQAATEDWKHRRPHRWRRQAREAWLAEGAQLEAKADRLRQMADDVLAQL